MSLPVTSSGTYKNLAGKSATTWSQTQWDTGLCPSCTPRLKRGQRLMGRRVIVGRMVAHRQVWKTVTYTSYKGKLADFS